MKNIIIFGASSFGKKVFYYYEKNTAINIVCFCDNNVSKYKALLLDKRIISPKDINNNIFDEIVIASSYEQEIYKQLLDMNIEKERITIFQKNTEELQLKNCNLLLQAKSLMLDIAQLFNKNSINYHIDHGTLLGLIRDNQILPWDIDIDFAILFQDKKKVINLLNNFLITYNNKYALVNKWKYIIVEDTIDLNKNMKDTIYLTIVNNANDKNQTIGLDIHIKYSHNERIYWMVAKRKLSTLKSFCFPTVDFIYENKKIKIPNNSNEYLKELYGDWRTPVKIWDYSQYSNIDTQASYTKKEEVK